MWVLTQQRCRQAWVPWREEGLLLSAGASFIPTLASPASGTVTSTCDPQTAEPRAPYTGLEGWCGAAPAGAGAAPWCPALLGRHVPGTNGWTGSGHLPPNFVGSVRTIQVTGPGSRSAFWPTVRRISCYPGETAVASIIDHFLRKLSFCSGLFTPEHVPKDFGSCSVFKGLSCD